MFDPRKFISFWRTPAGRLPLFLLAGALVLFTVRGCKQRAPLATSHPPRAATSDFLAASATRLTQPFRPTSKPAAANPVPQLTATTVVNRLSPISFYVAPLVEPEEAPADFAPYGRLIRCQLVITEESANIATPIVGSVLQDLWYSHRLIVPAGSEVHGTAAQERTRDRIASQGTWTIVLPGGRELTVSGIALNHDPLPDGTGWDILDGIAGLHGQILKSDDFAELKLFASEALSAAADALKTTQPTVYGTQPLVTGKNAVLAGGSKVLDSYAQQIAATLEREGTFVRVPAGKQFYLYVTETIDLSKARIAGTRAHPETRAGLDAAAPPGAARLSSQPSLNLQPQWYARP